MPTGYTAELLSKNLDFRGFALLCVRAMGVAITMRDDSLDTPLPDQFEPSDYNLKAGKKAKAKLAKLQKMTREERIAWAKKDMKKEIKLYQRLSEENNHEKNSKQMEAMLVEVNAWTPPTKDHQGFKDFMVQQLTSSIDSERFGTDYYGNEVTKLQETKPLAHFKDQLTKARKEVAYHKKQYAEEVHRVEVRNQWIKKLRDSLKI